VLWSELDFLALGCFGQPKAASGTWRAEDGTPPVPKLRRGKRAPGNRVFFFVTFAAFCSSPRLRKPAEVILTEANEINEGDFECGIPGRNPVHLVHPVR
jgi:hypothetical protein